VLDIGGQDTKAIQVDPHGIVESFQMNDRCAAGCGATSVTSRRNEHGPARTRSFGDESDQERAHQFDLHRVRRRGTARPPVSGEKREDIMLGLHRAIILRAMSILARSGGVRNEFTFTGGVGKTRPREIAEGTRHETTANCSSISIPIRLYRGAGRRDLRLGCGGRRRKDCRGKGMKMTMNTTESAS